MTGDENGRDMVYRTTIFMNSGGRIEFGSRDRDAALGVKRRFRPEHFVEGIPLDLREYGGQRATVNARNVDFVLFEEIAPGQEGYDMPLEKYIYLGV